VSLQKSLCEPHIVVYKLAKGVFVKLTSTRIPTVEASRRGPNGKYMECPQCKLAMPLIQHHAGAYSLRGVVSLTAKPAMIDPLAWCVDTIPAKQGTP
jgi:hypothetical protein